MTRPQLTAEISPEEFLAHYWLKEELVRFCRAQGLPSSGGKAEVSSRLAEYLKSGDVVTPTPTVQRKSGKMPEHFSRDTVIGQGWRCSQDLRAFFEEEIGAGFHFNGFLRQFIKSGGMGKTLGDAIDGWHLSKQEKQKPIGAQFEYNQHMRDFYAANSGASREDAIAAWYEKRGSK